MDLPRLRRRAPDVLAAIFAVSGVVHLVSPAVYESIVPRALPAHRAIVYLSGVAELACAVGLVRRVPGAGVAAATLLVLVFPANVQMALDAGSGRHAGLADDAVVAWARLPLQVPLMWMALQADRPLGHLRRRVKARPLG